MEENQPSAQAEQAQTPSQPEAPAVNEGIQKRIDQLVAERAESERQKNELLARVLELSAKQSAPAPAPSTCCCIRCFASAMPPTTFAGTASRRLPATPK